MKAYCCLTAQKQEDAIESLRTLARFDPGIVALPHRAPQSATALRQPRHINLY